MSLPPDASEVTFEANAAQGMELRVRPNSGRHWQAPEGSLRPCDPIGLGYIEFAAVVARRGDVQTRFLVALFGSIRSSRDFDLGPPNQPGEVHAPRSSQYMRHT